MLDRFIYFFEQIIDLVFGRFHRHRRVEQARRPDDLFHESIFWRVSEFIFTWRCRHIYRLVNSTLKLIEAKGAVVMRARQTETVVDQRLFAAEITLMHSPDLRNADV